MFDLPLHSVPLAFLDFETTGLYPRRGDRVCELAVERVVGGAVARRYATLVNPQRALSERSFAVNRITPEQLAGAPTFAEVAFELRAALEGATIVAHNAPFDLEFLHAEMELAGQPALLAPAIDTLALARRLFPKRHSHSLAALASIIGLAPPSHRAMDDVVALRAVFGDMAARLAEQGVTTLGGVLRYARGFDPWRAEPPPPPPIAEALREGRLLKIVYSSRSSAGPTERVIRPIELVSQRGVVVLRAYCYLREDLRVFLVERMTSIEIMKYE
jgi:DNA polymerase-3 subunit epsilon